MIADRNHGNHEGQLLLLKALYKKPQIVYVKVKRVAKLCQVFPCFENYSGKIPRFPLARESNSIYISQTPITIYQSKKKK